MRGYDDRPPLPGLSDHANYNRAKTEADIAAAIELIEDIFNEDVLDRIVDEFGANDPLVIAPARTPDQNRNALSISYAQ